MNSSEVIQTLISMGFPPDLSANAVGASGGQSIEEIVMWILENRDTDWANNESVNAPQKMIVVVRADLRMSTGKITAQSIHAALGAVESAHIQRADAVRSWIESGEAVICLQVESEDEFDSLIAAAEVSGLNFYVVSDAGRTEVSPGTRTCFALGPDTNNAIDKITRHLKLL